MISADFNALDGADTATVDNLAGTDVKTANANLAAALAARPATARPTR